MTAKPPVLSIVIPVYNQWPLTLGCLHSLREHTPGSFFEVVVVDNGSTDETVAELAGVGNALFGERFKAVRLNHNAGFGPGCNLGAEQSAGELLFFLNNDTLMTPGWAGPLMKALRDEPDTGAVGPLLLYPDSERVQHVGVAFNPGNHVEHLYAYFPADHPAVRRRRHVQALTGAALLLERGLFQKCGGFWREYVNGLEDLDLSCQIRRLGHKLRCVPESVIHHLTSQTPGRYDHDTHNAQVLNRRCAGCFAPDLHRLARRDGFELALTPWLDTYLRLPPEREAELDAANTPFTPAGHWETLAREPLWPRGYTELADHLEAHGNEVEASYLRFLHAFFFPGLESLGRLAKSARAASRLDLVEEAATKMARVKAILNQPEELLARARALRDWAGRAGEAELAALYDDWLARQGQGQP